MMTDYQIYCYFLIYAFLGWVVEVSYHAIKNHKIVNRGFLCGPWCPVYGFGMLGVLVATGLIADLQGVNELYEVNMIFLFVEGVVITTSIELVAGWILYVLFHARWWDYSGEKFNLKGFICLKFSILWGIGVVFVIKAVHPIVRVLSVGLIPERIGIYILGTVYLLLFIDFAITLSVIAGMNKYFTELDTLQAAMKLPSDKMTGIIAANAMQASGMIEEGQLQTALAKAEFRDATEQQRKKFEQMKLDYSLAAERLKEGQIGLGLSLGKQEELIAARIEELTAHFRNHNLFDAGRLLRAFPNLQLPDHEESLRKLREMLPGNADTNN